MPQRPSDPSRLQFAVPRPSDVPEMCRMLAETFTQSDPPAVAVGLTPAEFEAFVTLVAAPETTMSLTIAARDLESGLIAGAMLTEDAATPLPAEMSELSAKFDPIFDLFGSLDAQVAEPPVTESGAAVHLFLLGVDERFAGRGIAQRLVEEALTHARAMGYRTAIVEATNRTSQHIFRKLGFSTRAQVSYADYRLDGAPVFASIVDHGGPMAMIRDL